MSQEDSVKTIVFLCGPITDMSYPGAADWREYAAARLPEPLVPLSALRGKPHLVGEERILQTYPDHPLTTDKGITARDFNDVRRAAVLLVNLLGAKTVSRGTLFELAWAYAARTPVVLVMEEQGNPHDYCMVRESASFVARSLDEGIELVKSVVLP